MVMQIAKDALLLTKYTGLKVTTLVGGIDYQKQQKILDNEVIDIVAATPGRLLDFVRNRSLFLPVISCKHLPDEQFVTCRISDLL